MASFEKGEVITAYKLNQIIPTKVYGVSSGYSSYSIEVFIHTGGYITCSFNAYGSCTASVTIRRWNGTKWTSVTTDSCGGGTSFFGGEPSSNSKKVTLQISTLGGAGYYRIEVQGSSGTYTGTNDGEDGPPPTYYIYASCSAAAHVIPEAVEGDYLVMYDESDRSGNWKRGEPLTAENLNSGLVTTTPTLA